MAVSPDGTRVYVTISEEIDALLSKLGSVAVIDTATDQVGASVRVGVGPAGVAVSPDGSRVYVANRRGGSVSVIDTTQNDSLANIVTVGRGPQGQR